MVRTAEEKFLSILFAVSDLRREYLEPLLEPGPVEETAIHLPTPVERAADDSDILQFRHEGADLGFRDLLDGARNAARHFLGVNREKQASSQVGNES